MGRKERKCTFWHVHPTKTQIRLRIRAVWSESSLSAWRKIASLAIQNAPSDDSDQTVRMRRLIWIFAGQICKKVLSRAVIYMFSLNVYTYKGVQLDWLQYPVTILFSYNPIW